MKKINPVGEKYGKLTVVSEHSKTRNGHYRYICQCECGAISNVLLTHLRQGNTTSCGCSMIKSGDCHIQWKGVGEISGSFWQNSIISSSNGHKRRKIELSVDMQYCWDLFLKQERKCAISGVILKFPKTGSDKTGTASLDRIDSGIGYIEGNVQWVHKDINIMKNKFNQDYFIYMCKIIANKFI